MATFVTNNASEVIRSSTASRKQMHAAALVANRKTADDARKFVRQRIPPPQGAGEFPGYAARGRLRNSVKVDGPVELPGLIRSQIYMRADRSEVYRRIHEYGGIIRAKNAPYLVFKVQGRWVRVKQVYIRPKRFWRGGWEYGLTRFQDLFDKYMRKALR